MELKPDHQARQVQLEKELEEPQSSVAAMARARYDDLFEFVPSACFALTGGGIITEVNHAGAALLGLPRDEVVNAALSRFVAPADHGLLNEHLSALAGREDRLSREITLLRPDG